MSCCLQFENSYWFWGMYFGPNCIAVLGCVTFMLISLREIIVVMGHAQDNRRSNVVRRENRRSSIVRRQNRAWKRMLWYNQRTIAFTIVYCLVSLFGYGCTMYVVLSGTSNEHSLEDYTDCLLEQSLQNPNSRDRKSTRLNSSH